MRPFPEFWKFNDGKVFFFFCKASNEGKVDKKQYRELLKPKVYGFALGRGTSENFKNAMHFLKRIAKRLNFCLRSFGGRLFPCFQSQLRRSLRYSFNEHYLTFAFCEADENKNNPDEPSSPWNLRTVPMCIESGKSWLNEQRHSTSFACPSLKITEDTSLINLLVTKHCQHNAD